jgi:signal transduction histidine kinase
MYRRVMETGEPVRKELFSTNLNLNSWFDISVVKRNEDGIAVTFANISAQREAAIRIEEQKNLLDNILRNSPIGITVFQAVRNAGGEVVDLKCILANAAAVKFTGIEEEGIYNRTVLEINPGFKNSTVFQQTIVTLEEGKSFHAEYYNDRSRKWLELSVVKMYEDRLMNVFRDITEIKEGQLLLEKNVEDLKRMNDSLEHFTYAASHDLKEPLRKIHIFGSRLRESLASQLDGEQEKYLERIDSAAERMTALIDDLLSYHEAGKVFKTSDTVNLDKLIGKRPE